VALAMMVFLRLQVMTLYLVVPVMTCFTEKTVTMFSTAAMAMIAFTLMREMTL
jgi:hypothetical protein